MKHPLDSVPASFYVQARLGSHISSGAFAAVWGLPVCAQVGIEGSRKMLYRLFVADHGDGGHRRPSLEAVLSSDMKPAASGGGMEAGPRAESVGPGW